MVELSDCETNRRYILGGIKAWTGPPVKNVWTQKKRRKRKRKIRQNIKKSN
jgi:hypothetical protein